MVQIKPDSSSYELCRLTAADSKRFFDSRREPCAWPF